MRTKVERCIFFFLLAVVAVRTIRGTLVGFEMSISPPGPALVLRFPIRNITSKYVMMWYGWKLGLVSWSVIRGSLCRDLSIELSFSGSETDGIPAFCWLSFASQTFPRVSAIYLLVIFGDMCSSYTGGCSEVDGAFWSGSDRDGRRFRQDCKPSSGYKPATKFEAYEKGA